MATNDNRGGTGSQPVDPRHTETSVTERISTDATDRIPAETTTYDRVGPQARGTREVRDYDYDYDDDARAGWRASTVGADDGAAGRNVSWGAILAGVTTMLGVLALTSLLGAAIGLGGTTITSNDPFAGVGTGMAIWGVVSLIIAFAAGGFVTGVLSVRAGLIHGIVTWAASVIASLVLASMAVASAFGLLGNIVSGAANAAGTVVSGAAEVSADAVSGIADQVAKNINLENVNVEGMEDNVRQALVDSGVPELQPDYLEGQLQGAQDEIANAGRELVVNPGNYQQILGNLSSQLETRVNTIGQNVDRDAVANALEKNTDLNQDEARQATDNAIEGLENAQKAANEQLENARKAIDDAQTQLAAGVQDVREGAEDVTNSVSKGALWTFFGLLLGGVITALSALWGSRLVSGRNAAGDIRADANAA